MSLQQYNAMQMCRRQTYNCEQRRRLCSLWDRSIGAPLEVSVILAQMDTSSSSITVSGHNSLLCGLVNADRLTSSCAKRRARGCEINQPTLPNCARKQLMRSPLGARRGLRSTCPEYEEARSGREARPEVLISPQNPSSEGNVQTKCRLDILWSMTNSKRVARRIQTTRLWPSPDTHRLAALTNARLCRQGASITTQRGCQLSDMLGGGESGHCKRQGGTMHSWVAWSKNRKRELCEKQNLKMLNETCRSFCGGKAHLKFPPRLTGRCLVSGTDWYIICVYM